MIRTSEWQGGIKNRYLRWAILVLVPLSGLAVGLAGSQPLIIMALGGIVALSSAILILKRPPVGVLALIVLSFAVPITIGTGTGTNVYMIVPGLALVVGIFLIEVLTGKPLVLLPSVQPIYLSLLIFVAAGMLAFLAGQLPWYPEDPAPITAQLAQLMVLVLLPALVPLMDRYFRSELWLKRLIWLFLGLGTVQVFLTFFPSVRSALSFVLIQSPKSSLFWVWIVCLAFGQAFFNSELSRFWRLFLFGITATALFIGLGISFEWASGWLPPLIGLTALVGAAKPRVAAVAGVIMLVLGVLYASTVVDLLLINEEYSAVTRVEAWKIILKMVMERSPLLGFGPANYRFYTVEYPILGWSVQFNSHNQYVDLLAQTGILGTAAFLWYSVSTGTLLWRLREDRRLSGFMRALVLSVFGGLVGTLVAGMLADWVLPYVYNITLSGMRDAIPGWIFMGAALSLHRIAAGRAIQSPDSPPSAAEA